MRLSMGRSTTAEEVDAVIAALAEGARLARGMGPVRSGTPRA